MEYAVRVLQTFTLLVQKHIAYAECHSVELFMVRELCNEVSINLLDSVLDNAGEVSSVV